ncbi:F0F1 ATP synthase subunit B [Candidatus Berkelbacteria bacterium]|nr:F0F1 ATP synthase subunit B [Candidatus Berkelbacteria bacterium]
MTQETPTTTQMIQSNEGLDSNPSGLAALGIDGHFLLAQLINFLVLFLLLRWLLYRPLLGMLTKRRTIIAESLAQAEAAEHAATEVEEKAAQRLAKAKTEAAALVKAAQIEAVTSAATVKQRAEAEASALLERTKLQLEREKETVLVAAQSELGALVLAATERVLAGTKTTVSLDAITQAVDAKRRAT